MRMGCPGRMLRSGAGQETRILGPVVPSYSDRPLPVAFTNGGRPDCTGDGGCPGHRRAAEPRYPVPVTTGHKSFGSDNHASAHPEVIQAIAAANAGDAHPYGADEWTQRAASDLCAAFGAAGAFFVFISR